MYILNIIIVSLYSTVYTVIYKYILDARINTSFTLIIYLRLAVKLCQIIQFATCKCHTYAAIGTLIPL